MKNYKVIYNVYFMKVEVEDFENEQDALDKVIDILEERGDSDSFINYSDTVEEGGSIHEDEYITGGNHGLLLYHGGNFSIKEFK